jgi:GT2 family glycosyltransferase
MPASTTAAPAAALARGLRRASTAEMDPQAKPGAPTAVTVVILNWNGWEDTLACLESVRQSDYPDFRIILVDNGSTNDSLARISAWCAGKMPVISIDAALTRDVNTRLSTAEVLARGLFISTGEYCGNGTPGKAGAPTAADPQTKPGALTRDVNTRLSTAEADPQTKPGAPAAAPAAERPLVILKTGKNLGFSEGNNVAIRRALAGPQPADVVFLLNNDTRIETGTVSRAVEVLRRRQAGIVGCVIKDATGTRTLFGGDLRPPKFFYAPYRLFLRKHRPGDEAVSVVWGTAMLIRRDVLLAHKARFGHFLNPAYFLYMEDCDFCFHTQKMGYPIIVAKKAVVYHGHTTNYAQTKFRNAITLYYSTRNAFHVANNFLPIGWRLAFYLYFPLVRSKDIFSLLIHRKTVEVRALVDGLWDGYRGVKGEWPKHPSESRTS